MGSELRTLILGEEFQDLLKEPERAAAAPADADALGQALVENLKAQLGIYVAYLGEASRQKMALVHGRLDEINDVNGSSDRLLSPLADLESTRMGIVENLLSAFPGQLALAAGSLKCEAIYPLLNPSLAGKLKACRESLLKAVEELRQVLAVSTVLAENGSKIIHATVAIMTSVSGRGRLDRMNTYTAKGAVHVGKVQIRNLINRSV